MLPISGNEAYAATVDDWQLWRSCCSYSFL